MKKMFITLALSAALVIPITAGSSNIPNPVTKKSEITSTFENESDNSSKMNISTVEVEQVAYSKSAKKFTTTANLKLRSSSSTKSKVIKVLKKNTTVLEISNKSGWKKVKAGNSTGWVSSKYLKNSNSKSSKKSKPSKKISIHSVKSLSQAKQWINQTCSPVKMKTTPGLTSYYLPGKKTIVLGSGVRSSYIANVVAHEMAHHYQWVYYRGNVAKWNKDLKRSKGKNSKIEVQADHMSFEEIGFKPHPKSYIKVRVTASQKAEVKKIIKYGKSKGC